jgi:hypothetical protein
MNNISFDSKLSMIVHQCLRLPILRWWAACVKYGENTILFSYHWITGSPVLSKRCKDLPSHASILKQEVSRGSWWLKVHHEYCYQKGQNVKKWQIVVILDSRDSSGWFTSHSWLVGWLVGWLSATTMCSGSLIYLLDLWGAMEEVTGGLVNCWLPSGLSPGSEGQQRGTSQLASSLNLPSRS